MSDTQQFKNEGSDTCKVYDYDGFWFVEPGDTVELNLPSDQEPRVLAVKPEDREPGQPIASDERPARGRSVRVRR